MSKKQFYRILYFFILVQRMQIRILFLVCIKVCFCPNESLQKHHKFKIHPAWAMNQDFVKNWSQWWADELHLSHLTQMEKNIGAGTFVWMFNFTLMKPFFQVTCLVFKRLGNCCFLPGFCISYLQGATKTDSNYWNSQML